MEETKRKTYRNFKRSEKAIIRAYAELMQKNGNKRITVTDIVDAADLNRSTFYSHFKSADEVREKIHSDIVNEIIGSLDEHKCRNSLENPYNAMNRVIEFIKRDEELYKKMLNTEGADKFLKKLKDIVIVQYLSDEVVLPHITDKDEFETNLRLFIGGFISVIEDWASGNMKMSLERCALIMSDSIKTCIERYVR